MVEPTSSFNTLPARVEPLPYDRRPYIGFRVEGSDALTIPGAGRGPSRDCWFNNETYLRPRASPPWNRPTAETFRSHLTWDRSKPSPLVSFYTTWEAALRRRDKFIRWGATEIQIYVVWIRDHEHIYDACEVARRVHVPRDPAYFKDEVLLLGGVADRPSAPEVRWLDPQLFEIAYESYMGDELMTFDGRKELETVQFVLKGNGAGCREAVLPVGRQPPDKEAVLWEDLRATTNPGAVRAHEDELGLGLEEWRRDAYKRLRSQMRRSCRHDQLKACILLLALTGSDWQVLRISGSHFVLVLEWLPSGQHGHDWLFLDRGDGEWRVVEHGEDGVRHPIGDLAGASRREKVH
ncbi:hypothetical protein SLS53_002516 [Cytospora paraplurivora]|uniref:Uncharacterized protein n=1 Tax=Cytospora paraplurivora TaxID=2898453 RepID=A0AAN9UK96_9PEZI